MIYKCTIPPIKFRVSLSVQEKKHKIDLLVVLRLWSHVSLTLCCFVVYSTRRFVLSLALCYFILVFFIPFSIAITSLGKERANLSAFCTFVRFALVWFCLFPLPLRVLDGLRLVIVAIPGLFSYLLFFTDGGYATIMNF